jgi:hypothetical protein
MSVTAEDFAKALFGSGIWPGQLTPEQEEHVRKEIAAM